MAYDRIRQSYDEQISQELLKQIAVQLVGIVGKNCITARTKDSVFAVLVKTGDWLQLQGLVEEIRIAVSSIRQVSGKPVTLRLKMAYKSIGDDNITDENIYETALKEVL